MFRETMCPSSEEITLFMWHFTLVILCGWLSGMKEHILMHTRQSFIQNIIWRNSCVYVSLGTCYSVWMIVPAYQTVIHTEYHQEEQQYLCDTWYLVFCVDDWYAGAYAPAYQTVIHTEYHQEEQLCLCDTWYLVCCVGDCLVCRSICCCIPDSHPYRISSGGTTVFMRHLVLVIPCGWLSSMQEHKLVDDHLVCRSICSWMTIWYAGEYLVNDHLVCRSICSCIPDSHSYRISSGGTNVLMRHLVFSILCGWLSGIQGGMKQTKKIAHRVGFIYKILQKCTVNKTYLLFWMRK